MDKERTFLNSKEVAHILDCTPDDIHVLVQRRELQATKEGRLWRYRPADVEAYKRKLSKAE